MKKTYTGAQEYSPLSPWSYWGLKILYSVPIVGFVFLIIFSIKKDNLNRRNFTLSYWCSVVLVLIVIGIIAAILLVTGAADSLGEAFETIKEGGFKALFQTFST